LQARIAWEAVSYSLWRERPFQLYLSRFIDMHA
jgi:hypothetical protein